jgi:hypothetical protein
VQATRENHVPVLAAYTSADASDDRGIVRDEFTASLAVQYAPPDDLDAPVTWADLPTLGLTHRSLRRRALDELESMLDGARLHGNSPAIMVSFFGIESSLLLVDTFWPDLAVDVPGDLVVGVPARDVLVITGSRSADGLAKARRCVDRMFYAGDEYLLTNDLLVWRGPGWEVFDPATEQPAEDVGEWVPQDRSAEARVWTPTDGPTPTDSLAPDAPDDRVLAARRPDPDAAPGSFELDDWPVPRRRRGRARYG